MSDEASVGAPGSAEDKNWGIIMDVQVEVTALLGTCKVAMRDVLELKPGTILKLEQRATDPIVICLNGRAVAHGEVVVVDECFGIKITKLCE
ncbi:FliM/FliN family flagellar motor switch protein [Ruficoccus amylovorans]|uniref:Flagellar motor switch protein FliN n=1 Tax=Ruficoccus amylovorans TaxID=1804625 RepID=A0A842HHJ4_9BACT|nr:FliM/FliN family flagellar motor switch protein [Ruficoccus amylovorans]MBC2595017.1 FliM/FliN family flagellar motor switch protein [Ruficoccus amylovorans]